MPGRVHESDVLVIGGGPAGSTAAQLLASWGRSVTIAHRPPASRLTLAESLPASTRKLLRFLGQLDRVDAAAFHPNTGNRAEWAGASRATTSADAGFHVPREAFDGVLRDHAEAAGARVVDATIQRVAADDPTRVSGTTTDGHAIELRARYVLDCSGRAGVIARHGMRRTDAPYRTLAIVAEWECDDWPPEEHTCTTIESYSEGWAWSVPLSAVRRQCTVMIEKGARVGPAKAGPHVLLSRYEREVAKAGAMRARLANARRVSAPWTCDASMYDCVRAAEGPVLLVGDAASFIEPLSSAGVKKALLSAWRAAVVTNTYLAHEGMAGMARDLYVRREREVYNDCLRRSSAFFAEALAAHRTPFWFARAGDAGSASDPLLTDADDPNDNALEHDDSVRQAFERLRSAGDVCVKPARALRFAAVPTIDGREVVLREAVLVPGLRSPLQYAAGVDLARLARIVSGGADVPTIIAAYQDHVGPVPLAGLLTGLSVLIARHALVTEERST